MGDEEYLRLGADPGITPVRGNDHGQDGAEGGSLSYLVGVLPGRDGRAHRAELRGEPHHANSPQVGGKGGELEAP